MPRDSSEPSVLNLNQFKVGEVLELGPEFFGLEKWPDSFLFDAGEGYLAKVVAIDEDTITVIVTRQEEDDHAA